MHARLAADPARARQLTQGTNALARIGGDIPSLDAVEDEL